MSSLLAGSSAFPIWKTFLSITYFSHSDPLLPRYIYFQVYIGQHFTSCKVFQLHHCLKLKQYKKTRVNIIISQLFGHFLPSLYIDSSAVLHVQNSIGILSNKMSPLPFKYNINLKANSNVTLQHYKIMHHCTDSTL